MMKKKKKMMMMAEKAVHTVDPELDVDEVLSCAVGGDTSVGGGVGLRRRVNDKLSTSIAQFSVLAATRIDQFVVFDPDQPRCRHPGHRTVQYRRTVDDRC